MKIVEMRLSELKPYENNPRNNAPAVDAVAESIKEFGFRNPIIVDKNNVIIAGHTRYKASKKLGLETVPVHIADDLSEEQAKALRLADNKSAELAEWDSELLEAELKGIEELDMSLFGFEPVVEIAEAEEDEFEAELPEEPRVHQGEVWKLGNHILMCGDSTILTECQKLVEGGVQTRLTFC